MIKKEKNSVKYKTNIVPMWKLHVQKYYILNGWKIKRKHFVYWKKCQTLKRHVLKITFWTGDNSKKICLSKNRNKLKRHTLKRHLPNFAQRGPSNVVWMRIPIVWCSKAKMSWRGERQCGTIAEEDQVNCNGQWRQT